MELFKWTTLAHPTLLLTPFPLPGFTLTPFMHVARQKAPGPLRAAWLTKPAYQLSSAATILCGSIDSAAQVWGTIYL